MHIEGIARVEMDLVTLLLLPLALILRVQHQQVVFVANATMQHNLRRVFTAAIG